MAGEAINVDVLCLHVQVNCAGALAAVHYKNQSVVMANLSDFLQRLDGADYVGAMRADDELGIRADGFFHIVGIHITSFVEGNVGHIDQALLLQGIERTKHGVVFQHGGNHVCTFFRQALDNHIQGIGGVIAESQSVVIITAVEELGEHLAGVGDEVASFDGCVESGTSRIHTVLTVKVNHEIINLVRFRERGG